MQTLRTRSYVTAVTAALVLAGTGTAMADPADSDAESGRQAASLAAPGRFHDGGFEMPRMAPNTFHTFTVGQSIEPWKVSHGQVDVVHAGVWQAAEGDQSLDLSGFEPGAVSQTFATKPGARYTMSYKLAGNPHPEGPVVKTGKVLIDGDKVQDFSFNTTGKSYRNMGYVNRRLTFVATGASTTLSFVNTTTPKTASGPVIDDVRVEVKHPCESNCGR